MVWCLFCVGGWTLACAEKNGDGTSTTQPGPTTFEETCTDPQTWWPDVDGDGYGNGEHPMQACSLPVGHVDNGDDCNDSTGEIGPEEYWWPDADGDGRTAIEPLFGCPGPEEGENNYADDCDDSDPNIHILADEALDGVDNDCDGWLDDIDPYFTGWDGWITSESPSGPTAGDGVYVGDFLGLGTAQVLAAPGQMPVDDTWLFDAGIRDHWLLTQVSPTQLTASERFDVLDVLDSNEDGVDDLLVTNSQGVWMLAGPLAGDLDSPTSSWTFGGAIPPGLIARVGDLDGDGAELYAVQSGPGLVHLIDVSAPGLDLVGQPSILSPSGTAYPTGMAGVTGGGDTDGDGQLEILVGETQVGGLEEGVLYVVNGRPDPSTPVHLLADAEIQGTTPMGHTGGANWLLRDLDGDGYDEVVTNIGGYSGGYAVHYGPLAASSVVSQWEAELPVGDVMELGDFDADGFPDLAVAHNRGWAMIHGPVLGSLPVEEQVSWQDLGGGQHPTGLAVIGDTDNDGLNELVISKHTIINGRPEQQFYLIDGFDWL